MLYYRRRSSALYDLRTLQILLLYRLRLFYVIRRVRLRHQVRLRLQILDSRFICFVRILLNTLQTLSFLTHVYYPVLLLVFLAGVLLLPSSLLFVQGRRRRRRTLVFFLSLVQVSVVLVPIDRGQKRFVLVVIIDSVSDCEGDISPSEGARQKSLLAGSVLDGSGDESCDEELFLGNKTSHLTIEREMRRRVTEIALQTQRDQVILKD